MAGSITDLYTAIQNHLRGDAAILALCPSAQILNKYRPGDAASAAYPRILFGITGNPEPPDFGISHYMIEVNIYARDNNVLLCQEISRLIQSRMHSTNFACSNFKIHWCYKTGGGIIMEEEGDIARLIDNYIISVSEV